MFPIGTYQLTDARCGEYGPRDTAEQRSLRILGLTTKNNPLPAVSNPATWEATDHSMYDWMFHRSHSAQNDPRKSAKILLRNGTSICRGKEISAVYTVFRRDSSRPIDQKMGWLTRHQAVLTKPQNTRKAQCARSGKNGLHNNAHAMKPRVYQSPTLQCGRSCTLS